MQKIYFFYPKGKKLTGQELASKLILDNFPREKFCIKTFPAYERGSKNPIYILAYFFQIFLSWLNVFSLIFVRNPMVYVNMSQGKMSLWRDGQPFVILSWFKKYSAVFSLHGHLFTTWNKEEAVCRHFVAVLKRAKFVTVLGEVQKARLIELGIAPERVLIIPNTCEILASEKSMKNEEIGLFYLSNLIEDKGYMEYLEALTLISQQKISKRIKAVLCGDLYGGEQNKSAKIMAMIEKINTSGFMTIEWIKGAYGKEKENLFRSSDMFIFPSKYKVEAQPIVLLEAMAAGCAIITTKVGEIPSTVSSEVAFVLDSAAPEKICEKILELVADEKLLRNKQMESIKRFNTYFSLDVYKYNWQKIFENL